MNDSLLKQIKMSNALISERLNQVYNAQTSEALAQAYNQWAEGFDNHSEIRGSRQPAVVSGFVTRYVSHKDNPILDAGAGTGLIGEFLHIYGYTNLIAIDFSENMLNIAKSKNIYSQLQNMSLTAPLDFVDNFFGAVVSAGVFTKGHVSPDAFDELIRVTRPNGHLIFTVHETVYINNGFKNKFDDLQKKGGWDLIEMTDPFAIMPRMAPHSLARVFTYQVCNTLTK